jgi:hypothetical protein
MKKKLSKFTNLFAIIFSSLILCIIICFFFEIEPNSLIEKYKKERIEQVRFYEDTINVKSINCIISNIPKEYEKQFKIASTYYPELLNTSIKLKFKPIETTMQARPNFTLSFFSIKSREYSVIINNDENFSGIQFHDVPFNAQIGLISHELGHILDYENKSKLKVVCTGISYIVFKKSKIKYEKSIDKLTIFKGAGWQLYDWADYAMNLSKATNDYKSFKKETYLQPFEIKKIIEDEK